MTDPISDMIIRIKNAGDARLSKARVPFSGFRFSVAKLLEEKGYIKTVAKKTRGKKSQSVFEIEVAYDDNKKPHIKGLMRISKPSRRVYVGSKEIKPVKNGMGAVILSTPKGILTGDDAKKAHVGGEALFKIW